MAELPIRDCLGYFKRIYTNQYILAKLGIYAGLLLCLISAILQHRLFSYEATDQFKDRISRLPDDQLVTAIVYMHDTGLRVNPIKRTAMLNSLHARSQQGQKDINAYLQSEYAKGGIRNFRQFWIINAIFVEGKASVIRSIYRRSDVKIVKENTLFSLLDTAAGSPGSSRQAFEWGIQSIQADRVWDTYGFKGRDIRIGHLDTGIDQHHPDLEGRLGAWAKIDAYGNIIDSEPYDSGFHGTHTAGIMVGGNADGSAIGVAPEATLLSAMVVTNGIGTFAQVLAGMEWVIDPDGNPQTDNGADILNLSLGMSGSSEDFIEPVDNLIAAHIFPAFSIGNSGQGSSSSPGNIPESFGVGAVDINSEAGFFSSGEAIVWNVPPYTGVWIKPDISAPGVNVKSSVPGGYSYLSGTSMASPFIAGAAALVYQANPELTVPQVKTILSVTSLDLGNPGKDTYYGWGLINVYNAVQLALSGDIPDDISEFNPETPWSYMVSPKQNQSIWGNAVTIMARGTNTTKKIIFQYQPAESLNESEWINIGEDSTIPFSLYWDVTLLEQGSYRLRSIACSETYAAPGATSWITVQVKEDQPDIYENGEKEVNPCSAHMKIEKINNE
ncbi:MAG: S8 family serine peptidase, partial [bacterium]